MSRFGTVDRGELARWADEVSARTELPRLIRRLILETTPGLVELGMPAGEGVSLPGWDGTVKSTEHTPWVPAGLSLWEMSVYKDAGGKATRDYEKRTSTPDGSPTTSAIYVALSLRTWLKRDHWARENTGEGRWKHVLAYGLDDVDLWLEAAPVTQAWLAAERGFHPYGYRSAEQWWEAWASQTDPRLPHAVLLAGREEQAENLATRLQSHQQVTTIRGRSRDEVCGFIVAVVAQQFAGLEGERLLAQMAFVDEQASWRELLGRTAPLVLVPMRREFALDRPASSPHHVVVPVTDGPADIELPRLDAAAVTVILGEEGLDDEEKAKDYGHLARRSLEALRLTLALSPALLKPDWAGTPIPRTVRAVLLVGSWNDECEGDQQILSDLGGNSYESIREDLNDLRHRTNPLVDLVNNAWYLISPGDAWEFLAPALTKDDLDRLKLVALRVLGERDPAFDLDPGQRWMANVMGKARAYSAPLRLGLARSLVLLSVHSGTFEGRGRHDGASWASGIARDLFPDAGAPDAGDMWGSLADVLPLLAEAAPEAFIAAVRKGLQGDDPPLSSMFTDGDTGGPPWGNNSPHPFLLWALERLAWHTDHFRPVADLLAALDGIDRGGRSGPRALDSLHGLMFPWRHGLLMPTEDRLMVLDALRAQHPECAWRLMVSLIPKRGLALHQVETPRFRDWNTPTGVGYSEYSLFVESLVERLVEDAATNPTRFINLIKDSVYLPLELQSQIIKGLKDYLSNYDLPREEAKALRLQLREEIRRHRSFSNSEWAFPDIILSRLEELTSRIEITDPVSESLWLFKQQYPLVPTFEWRSDEYTQHLAKLRVEAVTEIYEQQELDGINTFIKQIKKNRPESLRPLGIALSDSLGNRLESRLLRALSGERESDLSKVAHYYFGQQFSELGWPWLDQLVNRDDLTNHQKALLLIHAEAEPTTWDKVKSFGPSAESVYWNNFSVDRLTPDSEYIEDTVRHLLQFGRIRLTLYVLEISDIRSEQSALLAIKALEVIAKADAPYSDQVTRHQIQDLVHKLQTYQDAVGSRRLALVEWALLPLLDPDAPAVGTLYKSMQQDPAFFVEIIGMVYLPRHRDHSLDREIHEDSQHIALARRAFSLLHTWRWDAGMHEDDESLRSALRQWVTDARQRLSDTDRLVAGEREIGKMLGRITDESGTRPVAVVT